MEISKVIEWALAPVVQIEAFPNTVVDIFIQVLQANASTRCAAINAASLALAHAGVPMNEMISAVSIGKLDKTIVTDLIKEEEDYEEGEGATDIPLAFTSRTNKLCLLQLDGKISADELKEVIKAGEKACREIYAEQKKTLKTIRE
jgi:exosome complex component RRP41